MCNLSGFYLGFGYCYLFFSVVFYNIFSVGKESLCIILFIHLLVFILFILMALSFKIVKWYLHKFRVSVRIMCHYVFGPRQFYWAFTFTSCYMLWSPHCQWARSWALFWNNCLLSSLLGWLTCQIYLSSMLLHLLFKDWLERESFLFSYFFNRTNSQVLET